MFLDLDFELLRLIFLYLEVRDLVNLYKTCRRFHWFFLLESARADGIGYTVKLRKLVAKVVTEKNSGCLKIEIYNRTPFSHHVVPSAIDLAGSPVEWLQRHIPSDCKPDTPLTPMKHERLWMWYDYYVVHIRNGLVTLAIDRHVLARLLQEYKIAISEHPRSTTISYIFNDRSVLRSKHDGLLGS